MLPDPKASPMEYHAHDLIRQSHGQHGETMTQAKCVTLKHHSSTKTRHLDHLMIFAAGWI
jgi:hypothetical protein